MANYRLIDFTDMQDDHLEATELNKKKTELAAIEKELFLKESALTSLLTRLQSFEKKYFRLVAAKYIELDELNAQTAEAEALLDPFDFIAQERAKMLRRKANQHHETAFTAGRDYHRKARHAWPVLKKLYREIVKLLHPDLTTNEEEGLLRHQMMIEVNKAYARCDEKRLRSILQEWESYMGFNDESGIEAKINRINFRIVQVRLRINEIETEIKTLTCSPIYELYSEAVAAKDQCRDLLKEMAEKIAEEIIAAKNRLAELKTCIYE